MSLETATPTAAKPRKISRALLVSLRRLSRSKDDKIALEACRILARIEGIATGEVEGDVIANLLR